MVKELLSPNILSPINYFKFARKVGVFAVDGVQGTASVAKRFVFDAVSRAVDQPIPYVDVDPRSQDTTGDSRPTPGSQPDLQSVSHDLEAVVLTPQPIPKRI